MRDENDVNIKVDSKINYSNLQNKIIKIKSLSKNSKDTIQDPKLIKIEGKDNKRINDYNKSESLNILSDNYETNFNLLQNEKLLKENNFFKNKKQDEIIISTKKENKVEEVSGNDFIY